MMTTAEFITKFANEKTAILQEKDINNNTILHYATKLGNCELVKYLVEKTTLLMFKIYTAKHLLALP